MTYSSSLALGRQRTQSVHRQQSATFRNSGTWSKNQNTTRMQARDTKLGPISNTILLIVLACLLGLLYLTQVTKTNAFGYKIDALQQQHSELQTEHDELQVSSARLQSLERVKNSDVAKKLVSLNASGTVQN